MKKLFSVLIILSLLAFAAAPVFAGGAGEKEELTVGVVIPYEIGWFTAFHEGFQKIADREGVKIVWGYHNYNADEETKAIQNMITLGVDAINVTSVSPASAEYSCRLANEAGIPIQLTESGKAEGEGEPFAFIDFDWFDVYEVVTTSLRKAEQGDLNVLWLQGFLGTPPVIQGIEGFKETVKGLSGIKLATDVQDGQYATAPSLDITKAFIQGGLDFNVALGSCQEITDGMIQALQEEKVDMDDMIVITVNGGPMDIQNLKDGELDYCLSLSPGLHGMICAQNLINYMNKKTYQTLTFSPIVWTTADDWQEKLIPWDVDESWFPVVDEFVKSGKYKPQLQS